MWVVVELTGGDRGLDLDLLALNLTNDPEPARFYGDPPVFKPEYIQVASIGSLTGLIAQVGISLAFSEQIYYYVNDHLGTPQKVMDKNGVVVWDAN